MKKYIELTKKEIKAVKKSIEHWKKDIQKPLLEGKKIVMFRWDDDFRWGDGDKRKVKCYGSHCPLCKLVDSECALCPYYLKYGQACDDYTIGSVIKKDKDGHWRKFLKSPNLKTCNNMIKALEKILE